MNGHKLTAEVAYTDPTRTQGLMHRRMLPENRGMLFVFRDIAHARDVDDEHATSPSRWPFSTRRASSSTSRTWSRRRRTPTRRAKPAKYALEMNKGWFAKRGIKPGARLEGIEKAPPAQ